MYYGMETGFTWGWVFPLICFGFMVLCMVGMIGGSFRGSRMGRGGLCGGHRHPPTGRRGHHLRSHKGASSIPKSGPDRSRLTPQRQRPGS